MSATGSLVSCPYAGTRKFSRKRVTSRGRGALRSARLQVGDFLFGGGDGIGAGDEAARRSFLARNRDERARELRRVAGLLSVLGFPVAGTPSTPRGRTSTRRRYRCCADRRSNLGSSFVGAVILPVR